jgi:ferrous iron transport protein A
VLRLFRRSRALPTLDAAQPAPAGAVPAGGACTLGSCRAGSWATVVEMACGDQEACRLRALGVCEGAHVNVVDARHATLLEVRGTRIAIGRALSDGITVRPIPAGALPDGPHGAVPAPAR